MMVILKHTVCYSCHEECVFLHDEVSFSLDEDLQFRVIITHVTGLDYSVIHYND